MQIDVHQEGPWKGAVRGLNRFPRVMNRAMDRIAREEARLYLRKVKEAFRTSGNSNGKPWEPLRPSSLIGRRGSKPLLNQRDLYRALKLIKARHGTYMVAIPSGAMHPGGQPMVKIAMTHEKGRTFAMTVTPKMHKAVMAKLTAGGGGRSSGAPASGKFRPGAVIIIRIPRRSFLEDTQKAHFSARKAYPRLVKATQYELGRMVLWRLPRSSR
jgi:hypothetical protein